VARRERQPGVSSHPAHRTFTKSGPGGMPKRSDRVLWAIKRRPLIRLESILVSKLRPHRRYRAGEEVVMKPGVVRAWFLSDKSAPFWNITLYRQLLYRVRNSMPAPRTAGGGVAMDKILEDGFAIANLPERLERRRWPRRPPGRGSLALAKSQVCLFWVVGGTMAYEPRPLVSKRSTPRSS
jgi:hypothetical protein